MAKILIAGIGYIGLSLAEKLKSLGHEVIGLCRSHKTVEFNVIQKDILNLKAVDLPDGIDYVFYMLSADERTPKAYQYAYVKGVAHLLSLLKNQEIKRFFYISSTGVYPSTQTGIITEQTKFTPDAFTGKALLEGETVVRKSGCPFTIVRFGGLYGPGRVSLLNRVMAREAQLSTTDIYTNRIHQADAVGMLVHLLNLPNVESLYLGVDCECVTYNEVLSWLATECNVSLKTCGTPNRPSKQISNQKILESGYKFIYPSYKEGYISLLKT